MQQKENTETIKRSYDSAPEREWARTDNTVEYCITTRMLDEMIAEGEKVLDIGGGPGRYSLWLAGKGYDVTLFDLSPGNAAFAREKAAEKGLPLKTICGNAMEETLYPAAESISPSSIFSQAYCTISTNGRKGSWKS